MTVTTAKQENPLSAPTRPPRTPYELLSDPSLSCAARVAFALMYPLLERHSTYSFSLEEIGAAIGFAERATTKIFAELEAAGAVVSRIGGRGRPKLFALGPAVRGGVHAIGDEPAPTTTTTRNGGTNSAIRGEVKTKRDGATQTKLNFSAAVKSRALSSSRPIAPGKLESNSHTASFVKATTTERERSSSSSFFAQVRETVPNLTRSTFDLLMRDFGAERIARQCAELPRRIAHYASIGRPVQSPDAFFVRSVRDDWGPAPAPVNRPPAVRQWQIDHADREMQTAAIVADCPIETREQVDANRAKADEYASEAEKIYAALPPAVRAEIDARTERAMRTVPATVNAEAAENFRKQFRTGVIYKKKSLLEAN